MKTTKGDRMGEGGDLTKSSRLRLSIKLGLNF